MVKQLVPLSPNVSHILITTLTSIVMIYVCTLLYCQFIIHTIEMVSTFITTVYRENFTIIFSFTNYIKYEDVFTAVRIYRNERKN